MTLTADERDLFRRLIRDPEPEFQGWIKRIADQRIVFSDIPGVLDYNRISNAPTIPTIPSVDTCFGFWTLTSLTADANHRSFSGSLNTSYDNGVAQAGSAMLAADGVINIRTTGVYAVTIEVAPYNGTLGISYSVGGRLLKNSVTEIGCNVSAAMMQPDDGTVGGCTAYAIVSLVATDGLKAQAWSKSGIGVRVFASATRLF